MTETSQEDQGVWQDEPITSLDADRKATFTRWRVLNATAAPVGWWAVRVEPESIRDRWHYQKFWAEPIAAWAVIEMEDTSGLVQQMVPMIDDGDGRLHPTSPVAVICQGEDPEAAYNAAQPDGLNEWATSQRCGPSCAACSG